MSVADKSSKSCKTTKTTTSTTYVNCTDVTSHFYRNWKTDSETQDLQMSVADVDKTTSLIGFTGFCSDASFKDASCAVTLGSPITNVNFVFPAFKAALDASAALEAKAASESNNTAKTGATSLTRFAASLVAALYTLAL